MAYNLRRRPTKGEDGDFHQLRLVREKRKKYPESLIESKEEPDSINEWKEFMQKTKHTHQTDKTTRKNSSIAEKEKLEMLRKRWFSEINKIDDTTQASQFNKNADEIGKIYNLRDPETDQNMLQYAADKGKWEIVKYLALRYNKRMTDVTISSNVDLLMSSHQVEIAGLQGKRSVLHIITEKNNIEMAEYILDRLEGDAQRLQLIQLETAVAIQGHRPRLFSCLHLAAYYGHTDLVGKYLKVPGINVDHLNDKKDTSLLWASREGHIETIKLLIKKRADTELKNDKGSTPLYWAIRYDHPETVKLLLDEGKADPNTQRSMGLVSPIIIASAYGLEEIVAILLEHKDTKVNIRIRGGEQAIHLAAKEGCLKVLKQLVDNTADIESKDELGDTPLLLAAESGHVNVVEFLIKRGANFNHRNHEGQDAWYYAIESETDDLLCCLVRASKDKDFKLSHPLCLAARNGKSAKMNFLLHKDDLDPNIADADGNTFLHHAAITDNCEIIHEFHDKIPMNVQNNQKNTPLHLACLKGHSEAIKTMLKYKATTDVTNDRGETVLHIAASSKDITPESVKELVEYTIKKHDLDVLNAKDSLGNNCLHIAGKFAKPDVLWEFRQVRFKDRDQDGLTPLHESVRPGEPEALDVMLNIFEKMNRDAKINEQSYETSETVLHLAVEEGHSRCIRRLISLGADISIKDYKGDTVLHRLTRASVRDDRRVGKHLEVLDVILDNVVRWWCIKENLPFPEEVNRDGSLTYRRQAVLSILNEINKDGLSVLDQAFKVGAGEMLSRLLMMPGITMFEDAKMRTFTFDLTGLTPRTSNLFQGFCSCKRISTLCDSSQTNDVRQPIDVSPSNNDQHAKSTGATAADPRLPEEECFPDHSGNMQATQSLGTSSINMTEINQRVSSTNDDETVKETGRTATDSRLSGVEWLVARSGKTQVTQILDIPPINMIEHYYTSLVARTFALLLIFHIIYMGVFTYIGVDLLGKLRENSSQINKSDPETILLYVFAPLEPLLIIIYVFYTMIRYLVTRDIGRRTRLSNKTGVKKVINVISSYLFTFVCFAYAVLVFAWIYLFTKRYKYQDNVLAAAICIGWMLTIAFTRGIQMIHYFYKMLTSMVVKDVFKFLFVYLVVLMAFGFSFHILFQVSKDLVNEYKSPGHTLFVTFNMMIGMGEIFSDDFDTSMDAVGRTSTYIKIFYILYIIMSTVILLNLLIAMMNDSYRRILDSNQMRWRIEVVALGIDMESHFPATKILTNVRLHHGYEEATQTNGDISEDRWYVTISARKVHEYMRNLNAQSNTQDAMTKRLENLELRHSELEKQTMQKLNKRLDDLEQKLDYMVDRTKQTSSHPRKLDPEVPREIYTRAGSSDQASRGYGAETEA